MSNFSPPPPPSSPATPPPTPPNGDRFGKDGTLVVAGKMMIVQAAVILLFGLMKLNEGPSSNADRTDHNSAVAAVMLFGGALLWTGIETVRHRAWGRVAVIVLGAISVLILLPLAIKSGNSGLFLMSSWSATTLIVAVVGKRKNA